MSEIHPAIKLVIPGRIRRIFRGGEILLRTRVVELLMDSAGSKPAPDFKFQIMNERNNFPR